MCVRTFYNAYLFYVYTHVRCYQTRAGVKEARACSSKMYPRSIQSKTKEVMCVQVLMLHCANRKTNKALDRLCDYLCASLCLHVYWYSEPNIMGIPRESIIWFLFCPLILIRMEDWKWSCKKHSDSSLEFFSIYILIYWVELVEKCP